MSRLAILLLLLGLTASSAFAQRNEPEYSGEISALAAALGWDGSSTPGFSVGGAWRLSPNLSLVGDFGKQLGTGQFLMVGIRSYGEEHYRMSGFLQILTGAVSSASHPGDLGYALGGGAGVDIRVTDRLTFRPLQVDLILPAGLRVSSGFAFRFGR
jgi:hypothetical protein